MPSLNSFWDDADLVRRLCYTLDFARQAILHLAQKGFVYNNNHNDQLSPEKIVGETALILLRASYIEAYVVRNKIDEVATLLIPHARNDGILLNICLYPKLALDYSFPHICLTNIGYPDKRFDATLTKAMKSYSFNGYERSPYQICEQQWIKKLWNNKSVYNFRILPFTLLDSSIDLLYATRQDMYVFTHTLMFTSGFDNKNWNLPRNKQRILDEADSLIAKCLDEQDYDLTAELLLSWPLAGKRWSNSSIFAFKVLTTIEDEVGFLPSLSIQDKSFQNFESENRKQYLYSRTYHTVYVMGLLCSVILQHRFNPPTKIRKIRSAKGSAEKLKAFLPSENKSPFWINIYKKLDESEQDSLGFFLFNILLIRSISKMHYENAMKLLIVGEKWNLTNSSIARQAAELLSRLGTLSAV